MCCGDYVRLMIIINTTLMQLVSEAPVADGEGCRRCVRCSAAGAGRRGGGVRREDVEITDLRDGGEEAGSGEVMLLGWTLDTRPPVRAAPPSPPRPSVPRPPGHGGHQSIA